MRLKYQIFFTVIILVIMIGCKESTQIDLNKSMKVQYGKEIILESLENMSSIDSVKINTSIDKSLSDNREAYDIEIDGKEISITGGGEAGILYGCLKVKEEIVQNNSVPNNFKISDSPAMKWRGISLQLMKLGEYNYAITPEEFPFFYDKSLWKEFLDFMVDQRFNYIILWNGHPFDYFVKFDKFKEAQSGMTDEQIQQNNDMLKWLIAEGGKRNIKFFFEFYNIHTSVYYQKVHNLPKQISKPTPELAAYTEYSIAKFVSEFPEVGLFVTPGEGLEREYSDEWINNVIFKAVKSTGFTPTIFMRAWFFDLEHARKIVDNYPDLYFVRKFNVEMIADTRVDPENREWAKLNGNFIVNIHLAANLEPFRWNPPSYIQTIVQNNIESGANGIHLHPRKAWRWPYGSEAGTKEFQWSRDTLFFTAWSRYSWNPDREKSNEDKYWIDLLTDRYGNKKAAEHFLKSFESGADILPALQKLIWLGYDNHTIVTAGATLIQLQNSKGIPFLSIKPTLRISEYIKALKSGEKITGETPIDFVAAKIDEAKESLREAKLAAKSAKSNLDEANRIVKDAEAILHSAEYYYHKLIALKAWILLGEGISPEKNKNLFIKYLSKSVNDYSLLCKVTERTYESTSDVPARHPVRFKKTPYHWKDLLPLYEKELRIYKNEIDVKRNSEFYKPKLNGLAGIFYSEPYFIDAEKPHPADEINFDWYGNEEIGRNWSIEWFGYLKAPTNVDVRIILSADRDTRINLGDRIIKYEVSEAKEKIENIQFEKDKFYPLEIYYDHPGVEGGFVKLEWSWDGHPKGIISEEYLFHSKAQNNKTKLLAELIKEMK